MKHITSGIFIFLCLVFILGTLIRLHPVLTNSFAFTYDVGRDMLNLSQIVYKHKIPLIGPTTGLPGLFYGPWWYYILTPVFFLSGGNPQGVDAFMAIVGLATAFVAYLLGKRLEDRLLGVFLAGLILFSSATVSLSVQIWNPNIAQLFVILVLFLLVTIQKKGISLPLYGALGALLGLTIDSEVVFGLLFSAGILISMMVLLRKKISLKAVGWMGLGLFIIFSPRIFFEIRHSFVMTTHILQLFGSQKGDSGSLSFLQILTQRIALFWDTWNWSFGKVWVLSIVALVSVVAQLFLILRKNTQTLSAFVVKVISVVSAVFFVGLLFFKHDIFSHYLVALPVYFLVISAVAMYALVKRFIPRVMVFGAAILFLVILMNPVAVFTDFFGPQWKGDPSVYRNQLQVIDYIYNQAKGKPFKYVTYTPAVFDYPYQYLFQWYGPKKYSYAPSEKASLMFFILEPNLQYPDLRTTWLNERKGDGTIVKEALLQGGITVQTRIE